VLLLKRVDRPQRHVRVAVDEAGKQSRPGQVDAIVSLEVIADRYDHLALDRDVDAGGFRARSIENDTACQDPPVRNPDPPRLCAGDRTSPERSRPLGHPQSERHPRGWPLTLAT
jgi:hypothetical protein